MSDLVVRFAERRLIFAVLLIGALAALFWTQSRYPQLDEKAMMSGAIQLADPISFDPIYEITPDMPILERLGKTTSNWIDTNKKGMTFGVLIAAAFLTLFGYLQKRSFAGGFSNSLLGMVMGAPLGVCVNCAAPIARGLYTGGMRAETTLSAMIASPTLNIVVMTMTFSLLPVYMGLAKIALSVFVILVAVPLICRLLPQEELQRSSIEVPPPTGWDVQGQESLAHAFAGFALSYLKNLWFIVKMTVPLMFVAGFLGAVMGTLLPQDLIVGLGFSVFALVLIAIVGTVLPVPIAFDVVLAGALLAGGLTHGYVFALLFTLGSFSIYSYLIVASTISARAASLIAATIAVLGILGGVAAHSYHSWQTQRALDILLGFERLVLPAAAEAQTAPEGIRIDSRPFAPRSPAAGETVFERVEAIEVGIDKPLEFSMKDMWPPFWEGRSLSAGDIDGDGDLDLVIASTEAGLYVYENDGGGRFAQVPLDLGDLAGRDIFNAALVDLDNDGWLDLFLATYLDGNMIVRNDAGALDVAHPVPVANRADAMLSMALSFGDVDRDGDLDVALGNWAAGWYRRIPGEESRNRLLFNQGGVLDGSVFADLPGLPGETLSILFSDIDQDGALDLLVGNDFELPDYVYFGDGQGGLVPVTRAEGRIPHTTNTTMAIKTADLHNSGSVQLYFAQIAGRSSVPDRLKMQHLSKYCDGISTSSAKSLCERNMAIKDWYKSGNRFDPTYAGKCQALSGQLQQECKAMLIKDLAIQKQDGSICSLIPADQTIPRAYCDIHFKPRQAPLKSVFDTTLPQIMRSNVLLTPIGARAYEDTAPQEKLEVGGWSWDTKVADFDNDGFQDIYIVNGTWVPNEVSPSNLFFHNQRDGTFDEASGPFGLEDYLMTAAATVFDIDHDGDLDVVAQPVNGPVVLFRNAGQAGNAVAVELRDGRGNSHGVGARLVAELADGTRMMREIQSGGGFMSFDAPVAHFGLGAAAALARLTVHWPAGGTTVIDGPIPAGATYRVIRE